MKLAILKTEKQLQSRNDRLLGIQSYGERNDYPQKLMEVVGASITGGACVEQFGRFLFGRGFSQRDFFQAIVNQKGQTADDVLEHVARDFAMFGGFALHVNWISMRLPASTPSRSVLRFEALTTTISSIVHCIPIGVAVTQLRRFQG